MEAKVYSQKGKEVGSVALPETVFGAPWNPDLVHQVFTSLETNRRASIAHAKMRGEVRGGGKKPWRQKGTGRARHGSTRSPIWVGGGVTHGPRNDKNFSRKVNKKMKTKALFSLISKKFQDGHVLFIDGISVSAPKTKEAKTVLSSLSGIKGYEKIAGKKRNAAYVTLPTVASDLRKSFRNIGSIGFDEVRNMNLSDVLRYAYIVIASPEESFKVLQSRPTSKK